MNTNENLEQNIITAPANVDFPSRIKQGDANLRPGDIGDKLNGVMIDRVQLSWDGDCVRTIGPGSYLGVGALVDPEHRRSATAVLPPTLSSAIVNYLE